MATTTKTAKRPAKKTAQKPAAVAAKTKATSKAKTATKPAAAKKAQPAKGVVGQSLPRDLNEHGFVKGSASERIVEALMEGGKDRIDVNHKVLKAIGNSKTRNGTEHNVSSLVANILKRLKERGYTIESSWVVVAPTAASKAAATRRAKKVAATKEDAPVAETPVAASKTARKPAAKKTAKKRPSKSSKA